jgi:ankyrin repeat protein
VLSFRRAVLKFQPLLQESQIDLTVYFIAATSSIGFGVFVQEPSTLPSAINLASFDRVMLANKLFLVASLSLVTLGGGWPIKSSYGLSASNQVELTDVKIFGGYLPSLPNGTTVLHAAAESGDDMLLEFLLVEIPKMFDADIKLAINTKDNNGVTALHLASGNGHSSVVQRLLKAGASLEIRQTKIDPLSGKSRGTPLHLAAISGHEDVVRLLLEAGADIEARNAWFRTPLQMATRFGHNGAAKELLKHGADIEARGETGETALHIAVERNLYKMVELLLDAGADMKARGLRGTPMDLAMALCRTRIAKLLRHRMEHGYGFGAKGPALEGRINSKQLST